MVDVVETSASPGIPDNGRLPLASEAITPQVLSGIGGVQQDSARLLALQQTDPLSVDLPSDYGAAVSLLSEDARVEEIFGRFMVMKAAEIQSALHEEVVLMTNEQSRLHARASDKFDHGSELTLRWHALVTKRLEELQSAQAQSSESQLAALLAVPEIGVDRKRTLLLTCAYAESKRKTYPKLQSTHNAKMRVMLERGLGPDGRLLPERSGFPEYFVKQTQQGSPLESLFGQRFAGVYTKSNRVDELYGDNFLSNPRYWHCVDTVVPEMKKKSVLRGGTDLTADTTPYSFRWKDVWDNPGSFSAEAKRQVEEQLRGKIVLDVFGGKWDAGGSVMQRIATEAGATWYVNEDRYAVDEPHIRDINHMSEDEMRQWRKYWSDTSDVNAAREVRQPPPYAGRLLDERRSPVSCVTS